MEQKKVDAYIFLHVRPGTSETLARELWEKYGLHSVPVWGAWDIATRARVDSQGHLYSLLNLLHSQELQITGTITYLIRTDQLELGESPPSSGRHAFILLNARQPSSIRSLLRAYSKLPLVVEAAGVLGPRDMVVSVRYESDGQLRELVTRKIQQELGRITNSETVIGMEGVGWPQL